MAIEQKQINEFAKLKEQARQRRRAEKCDLGTADGKEAPRRPVGAMTFCEMMDENRMLSLQAAFRKLRADLVRSRKALAGVDHAKRSPSTPKRSAGTKTFDEALDHVEALIVCLALAELRHEMADELKQLSKEK